MRTALIGANGQLGTALRERLGSLPDSFPRSKWEGVEIVALGHDAVEIADAESVAAALAQAAPQLVINAAAYNQVDQAEDEPAAALAVNALGPRNLARWCAARDVPLVHVSTDYVFSGHVEADGLRTVRTRPYAETDRPEPLSAYGVSKLAGELFVRSICPRQFVIRTCGLYGAGRPARAAPVASEGRRTGGGNFVETMLRLAGERDELTVVNDQCCTPTFTGDLAESIIRLIATGSYGLYHATNSGETTWYEFACEIFRLTGTDVKVRPVTSADYGAKAVRPACSVLDCQKLSRSIGGPLRPWREALAEYLSERPARR